MPSNTQPAPTPAIELESKAQPILLSPRVIDQTAFIELASRLSHLIEDATHAGQTAARAASDARAAAPAAQSMRAELETAKKLIIAVDDQAARNERLVSALDHKLQAADQIEIRVDELVAAAIAKLDQHTSDIKSRLTTTLNDILMETQRADAHLDDVRTTVARATEAGEKRLRQMELRIEELLNARAQDVDNRLSELDITIKQRSQQITEIEDKLTRALTPATEAIKRAETLTAQTAAAAQHAHTALQQCQDIRAQAEEARKTLSDSVLSAIESIDQLDERAQVTHRAAKDAATLARSAAQDLQTRIDQLESQVQKPTTDALANLRLAHEDSAILASQLDATRQSAAKDIQHQKTLLNRIEKAAAQLEPWRAALLDNADSNELPPALATLVERARQELSRPLIQLGQVMRSLTDEKE